MRTKLAGSAKGSPSRGSCRRRRLRGFFPEAHLSTIITLTKHKVAEEMFSFARQKRTRKAPATFDAREARPGFHPGPKSGGRRNKIGRGAGGTDAFYDFAPAPILKGAYRKRQQGGEKPSPSRLRRATPPESTPCPPGDTQGNSWTERVHLPKPKQRPQFSLRAIGFSTRFRSNGGKLSHSYAAYQAKPTAPFS